MNYQANMAEAACRKAWSKPSLKVKEVRMTDIIATSDPEASLNSMSYGDWDYE